ncbi:helix-turn-helix transcriptional regulator [Enterovibrio baiacu]|uniref:helix-turn-helix transcriptional regulator n=1 Tax=Enterovibrio baiacu TaxID=2491023 RepID=UPI001F0C489A|nr:helix-turn-helix domain-containing protein [Enterovibrio baiacu]
MGMNDGKVIEVWQAAPIRAMTAFVVPDGCRDVIVTRNTLGNVDVHVSPLFDTTLAIEVLPNQHLTGYRLQAGTLLDEAALLSALAEDEHNVEEKIATFASSNANVYEALSCMREHGGTVASIAAELGVSERTLQRHVQQHSGKSPLFWLRLARIRQSALALVTGNTPNKTASLSVCDIAFEFGFSDQAHFCREIKHWFGVTPEQLKTRQDLIEQLYQAGY